MFLFLGTAYLTENAKVNNELTFKADDGLGSDIQVYEDSDSLIQSDSKGMCRADGKDKRIGVCQTGAVYGGRAYDVR